MSTGSSIGIGPSASSDKETDSIPGYPSTPEGTEKYEAKRSRKRKGKVLYLLIHTTKISLKLKILSLYIDCFKKLKINFNQKIIIR